MFISNNHAIVSLVVKRRLVKTLKMSQNIMKVVGEFLVSERKLLTTKLRALNFMFTKWKVFKWRILINLMSMK